MLSGYFFSFLLRAALHLKDTALADPVQYAAQCGGGYGRGLFLVRWCNNWCSEASDVSGALFYSAFYLQITAFSEWAMVGSNQRPPPCKGGKECFRGLKAVA